MKYKEIELTEMLPANWDGNTRQMLVWNDNDDDWQFACVIGYTYIPITINGFTDYKRQWICDGTGPWAHCAEIPKEESIDVTTDELKAQIKRLSEDNKNWCNLFNEKSIENDKLLEENKLLKEENKELKEKIKSLQFERSEMARDVAWAVDNELIEKSVLDHPHSGHRITIIHELIEKKILEYIEYKPKKLRRMTYKELDEWLEQGKGVVKIADHVSNTITYDCESRNQEVYGGYKICGYDEDTWHYPMIEV